MFSKPFKAGVASTLFPVIQLVGLLCLISGTVHAQSPKPWTLARIDEGQAPTIDGQLTEQVWLEAPANDELYQVFPELTSDHRYKITVKILADTEALYIGAQLSDPSPADIKSTITRRDHVPDSNDSFWITIDPTGSRTFGQVFAVNPDCSFNDGIYDEANLYTDTSQDFFFAVACQKHADGWNVELRIPFSELRFDTRENPSWNILIRRVVVRDQFFNFSNVPLPRQPVCILCQAPGLNGLGLIEEPKLFRIAPYVASRSTESGRKNRTYAGADLKYRIAPDSIIDATVSPDFSQVNLDEPQLSANTRFALSVQENRSFFLEGADLLSSPLSSVYTRTISEPSWGAKITKRSSELDFIALAGDDRTANAIILPGPYSSAMQPIKARQNFFITRGQLSKDRLKLGLTYTGRYYKDLGHNQTLGPDFLFNISDETNIRLQSIVSDTSNALSSSGDELESSRSVAGTAHYVFLQHHGATWLSDLEWKRLDQNFRSDLGFNPQVGIQQLKLTQGINQNLDTEPLGLNHIQYYAQLNQKLDLHNSLLRTSISPGVKIDGPLGLYVNYEYRPNIRERTQDGGELHRYSQQSLFLGLYPGSILTFVQCDIEWGKRLDFVNDKVRDGTASGCSATMNPLRQIELKSTVREESLVEEKEGKRILRNTIWSNMFIYSFTPRFAVRYLQQEDQTKRSQRHFPDYQATQSYRTDSLTFSYESPDGFALYMGASSATTRIGEATQEKEFFAKVSGPI
jgi:hypothetical protein